MTIEMEEWLKRMMSQFVRQVQFSGSSAVWVLPKEKWETARLAVATFVNPKVVVMHPGLESNSASLFGNLERLADSAKQGDLVLILLDNLRDTSFLNLLLQLVGYGGRIRRDELVFAFGIDTFTIHKDFYFSVFADPADYRAILEPKLPKNKLGPVFYLTQ